jgi:hypothetical protein
MIGTQPGALYIGTALGISTGNTFLISPSIGGGGLALQALDLGSVIGPKLSHCLVGRLQAFLQRLNMVLQGVDFVRLNWCMNGVLNARLNRRPTGVPMGNSIGIDPHLYAPVVVALFPEPEPDRKLPRGFW